MQISHARSGAGILGLALATLAALAIAVPAAQAAKPSKPSKDVSVQLLGINDFHGNLEPPTGSGGRIQEVAGGTPSPRAAPSTSPTSCARCASRTPTR